MKKLNLPYLARKKIRGRVRYFYRTTWTEAGKRRERFIEINADPDTQEFTDEYWAIRSGRSPKLERKPSQTSWRVLIAEFRGSPTYKKLSDGTKKPYNRWMERILEKNADIDVRDMTRSQIRTVHQKWSDKPREADHFIQVTRRLLNFAKKQLDWDIENPAEGIELYGKQREWEPWPEWMIAKLVDAPETVRTAAELILGTGQRPSAAITMRRDQFRGESMMVTDDKSDDQWEVYCPAPLRDYLDSIKPTGAYVLSRNLTQPMGYDSIEKAFRAWRSGLGPNAQPYVLHGLRKLAIVRLAEAGCTDAQIQAITGQTPEIIAYYRKRASRAVLSKQAFKLVEQNKNRK